MAAYSTETKKDKQEGGNSIFVEHFLPSTIAPFNQLRRDMHRTIIEIQRELGCKSSLVQGRSGYEVYFDLERQDLAGAPESGSNERAGENGDADSDESARGSGDKGHDAELERPSMDRVGSNRSLDEQFRLVSARLEAEAEQNASSFSNPSTPTAMTPRPLTSSRASLTGAPTRGTTTPGGTITVSAPEQPRKTHRGCAKRLKEHFEVGDSVIFPCLLIDKCYFIGFRKGSTGLVNRPRYLGRASWW